MATLAFLMAVASDRAINAPGCEAITARAAEKPDFWCTLFAAKLEHAELDEIRLIRVNLRRAFMHSVQLRRANMEDAQLQYANLIAADLRKADLQDARLDTAVLWEVKLDSARMKEAGAPGADFRGASLRSAELQGVDFTGAKLRGVDWADAIVCGATFSPDQVNTVALQKDARGWDRAFGTRPDSAPATLDNEPPPAYLRDDELPGYMHWRRAWHAARAGPPPEPGGRVDYEALRSYLVSIDLSMAESRQREQEVALARLEELRAAGTLEANYAEEVRPLVDSLRVEIKRKAANHCVDVQYDPHEHGTAEAPAPRPGPWGPRRPPTTRTGTAATQSGQQQRR